MIPYNMYILFSFKYYTIIKIIMSIMHNILQISLNSIIDTHINGNNKSNKEYSDNSI